MWSSLQKFELNTLNEEIQKNQHRIDVALRMMLDGELNAAEYKAIRSKYEEANTTLFRERTSLDLGKMDYSPKIQGCFNLLMHLDKFYAEANVEVKQKIVGLNFPEKLIFENGRFQTPKMSDVLSLIMLDSSMLEEQKKGQRKKLSSLSPPVHSQGFKPRTF